MANKVPFFLTGASAKIRVNNLTLAFCTDVQYSIRVAHAAPRVLGTFEASTLEPLSYDVRGQFSVIRYTRELSEFVKPGSAPDGVNRAGNSVGAWGPYSSSPSKIVKDVAASSLIGSVGGMSRADQSFDPAKLHFPMFFDIEIFQKAVDPSGSIQTGMVAKMRNCRLTGTDWRLSKRGVATQVFTFQACYADEDSFMAMVSGIGQLI